MLYSNLKTCSNACTLITNKAKTMNNARIEQKGNNWYYISNTYQGSHINLYVLLMAAKQKGE